MKAAKDVVKNTKEYTKNCVYYPEYCCDMYRYGIASKFGSTALTPDTSGTSYPQELLDAIDYFKDLGETTVCLY